MPGNPKRFYSEPDPSAEASAPYEQHPAPYLRRPRRKPPWGLLFTMIVAALLVWCYDHFYGKMELGLSYVALNGDQNACLKRDGKVLPLTGNTTLKGEDEILTHDSPLTILLFSAGSIRLGPKTHLIVGSGRKAAGRLNGKLELVYGRCWLQEEEGCDLEIVTRERATRIQNGLVDFYSEGDGNWIISVWYGEAIFQNRKGEDVVLQKGNGLTLNRDGTFAVHPAKSDKWKSLNQCLSLDRILAKDVSLESWAEAARQSERTTDKKIAYNSKEARQTRSTPSVTLGNLRNTPPSLHGGSSTPATNRFSQGTNSSSYPTYSPNKAMAPQHSGYGAYTYNPGGGAPSKGFQMRPGINPYYEYASRLTDRGLDQIPADTEIAKYYGRDVVTITSENDLKREFQKAANYFKQRFNMVLTRSCRLVLVARDDFSIMGPTYPASAEYPPSGHSLYFRENIDEGFLDDFVSHEFAHAWLAEYHHYAYKKEVMDYIHEGFALWIQMKYALSQKDYPQAAFAAKGLASEDDPVMDPSRWDIYCTGIKQVLKIEEKFGERGVFKYVTTGVNPME